MTPPKLRRDSEASFRDPETFVDAKSNGPANGTPKTSVVDDARAPDDAPVAADAAARDAVNTAPSSANRSARSPAPGQQKGAKVSPLKAHISVSCPYSVSQAHIVWIPSVIISPQGLVR